MGGEGKAEDIQCRRTLSRPIEGGGGSVRLGLRFILGSEYEIRFYDSRHNPAVSCCVDRSGWIRFRSGNELIDSGRFLTWFRGRPCVDPDFIPGTKDTKIAKSVETDEQSYIFREFDFANRSFTFELDGQDAFDAVGCIGPEIRDISAVELVSRGSATSVNRIRLRYLEVTDSEGKTEKESYPIYWWQVPAIPRGYPDDNTREARIRPVEGRWLECSGEYCWIKARLPAKLANGELVYHFKTPDISKESCLELHEENGAMADSTWPIKMGINHGRFFSGFASAIQSTVLSRPFFKSQQALFDDVIPEPNTDYEVRVRWSDKGTYRWWVNDTPMLFSGIARSGHKYDFPGITVPGQDIPFTNAFVFPPFEGIDTLGLHYGAVTHAYHTVCYGEFQVSSLR